MEKKYVNHFSVNCLNNGIKTLKEDFSEFNQETLLSVICRIHNPQMIGEFLSHLDNNRNKWNTDLTRYDWGGNIIPFNLDDVLREVCLKKDAIILCGHVSKVYLDEDAYTTQILDGGQIVDLCEDCFNKLLDDRLFTVEDKNYNSVKERIGDNLKTSYFWDGSIMQLQIALEKIKG